MSFKNYKTLHYVEFYLVYKINKSVSLMPKNNIYKDNKINNVPHKSST